MDTQFFHPLLLSAKHFCKFGNISINSSNIGVIAIIVNINTYIVAKKLLYTNIIFTKSLYNKLIIDNFVIKIFYILH